MIFIDSADRAELSQIKAARACRLQVLERCDGRDFRREVIACGPDRAARASFGRRRECPASCRPIVRPGGGGLDLAGFLRLSEKLTGRANLPPESARRYFQSIVGPTAPQRRGKAATGDGQAARDSRIVADWYSGQTIAAGGMVCVDYAGALLWEAIGFAKPRGVPDADAGRWALAPY